MQSFKNNGYIERPSFFERLLAALNYLTFGLLGFIYLIINAIRSGRMSSFLQYHIFQSFFLAMLYWLLGVFTGWIVKIICFIKPLNILVEKLNYNLLVAYSLESIAIKCVLVYLIATSLIGLYSYIPWVSDIIKRSVRR